MERSINNCVRQSYRMIFYLKIYFYFIWDSYEIYKRKNKL